MEKYFQLITPIDLPRMESPLYFIYESQRMALMMTDEQLKGYKLELYFVIRRLLESVGFSSVVFAHAVESIVEAVYNKEIRRPGKRNWDNFNFLVQLVRDNIQLEREGFKMVFPKGHEKRIILDEQVHKALVVETRRAEMKLEVIYSDILLIRSLLQG